MNKFFNGKKYYLEPKSNRWYRTIGGKCLYHDVWDFYHSGDPILKGETVHHKNGDSSDNRIENLQKMTRSEHSRLHKLGKHFSGKTKQKIGDTKLGNQNNLGKHWSDETKQKMSKAKLGKNHPMYGKHHTEETKQKMRNVKLGNKNPNWQGGKKN